MGNQGVLYHREALKYRHFNILLFMKHFIFLYWIICFTGGISCLVFFIILSAVKKEKHYQNLSLFLFSFTVAIGALTVRYYLLNIADSEELSDIFKLISLLGMGLGIYALPKSAHYYMDSSYKTAANRTLAITAMITCTISLVTFCLKLENLFTYNYYLMLGIFIICVLYSMVILIRQKPKKKKKHHTFQIMIAVITIIVLPIFLAIDMLYNEFKFLHDIIPRGFYALPSFYLFLSLMITIAVVSEGSIQLAGNYSISEKFIKKYNISSREIDILKLLVKGKSYKEIGAILFISLPTAKTHVINIYRKTGINSKVELINLLIKETEN